MGDRVRVVRLRDLSTIAAGWIRVGKCRCGHIAALPLALLIRKFGPEQPAEMAMITVKCTRCGRAGGVRYDAVRLCEPGCSKQRC